MNFKYFVLTLALIPSIAYTMDEAPKKKSKRHKKEVAALIIDKPQVAQKKLPLNNLVPKNNDPSATHITSMATPITFHKKTQSIFQWLKNHRDNHFGNTPIVVMGKLMKRPGYGFDQIGFVRAVVNADGVAAAMGDQNTIYISNTSKQYFPNKKKPISYGTLLIWTALEEDRNYKGHSRKKIISENVKYATNHFLARLTTQQPETAEDKGKQEESDDDVPELVPVSDNSFSQGSSKIKSNMSEVD